ncbi:MAG: dynamin family protein [Thermoguttaceae bacterium]|nr:dynamin family protein [Thermoguttaceae bacterium]
MPDSQAQANASPPPPIEIQPEQLSDYGTEDGNPNNSKRVDFIGIQLPHPLLQSGVVIVDTPGLGGLFAKHREITWRYVPNADAVFFVLDSVESVISQAEVDMLMKLRERNPLIFFVQTKIDAVEQVQWQRWKERNLQVISEKLGVPADKLIYFPVSAKLKQVADATHSLKHLERSGFLPVLRFLQDGLIARKEDQMGRRLLSAVATEAANLRRKLAENLHIATAESKERLAQLEQSLQQTKTQYDQWKTQHLPQIMDCFSEQLEHIRRTCRDKLQQELDPSPYGQLVSGLLEGLRAKTIDLSRLQEEAQLVLNECLDRCCQIASGVSQQYHQQMQKALEELSEELGKSLSKHLPTQQEPSETRFPHLALQSLEVKLNRWEEARGALYGGMAGGMVAHIATYLMALVAPPLIMAGPLAYIVGVALGALKTSRGLQERRQEEARMKIQNCLCDFVRRYQLNALSEFDQRVSRSQRHIRRIIQQVLQDQEQEISTKLQTIAQQRSQSQQEIQQKAETLRQQVQQTDQILQAIARLVPAPSGR